MTETAWKVGELARRTGVTIRTLHHYDDIGLLSPSRRTESGHRLYTAGDVQRLQQILALQALGFSLSQVRECLDSDRFTPLEVIAMQLARLDEQLELQQRLRRRLEALAGHLREAGTVSAEEFLQTIEVMQMIENYYTPEQLEYLKKRREEVGEERIKEVEQEWPKLMAEVRAAMDAGLPPESPEAQGLARRWQGLVEEFTGGDPGVSRSLGKLWQEQGDNLARQHHMNYDPAMFEYIGKAQEAAKRGS